MPPSDRKGFLPYEQWSAKDREEVGRGGLQPTEVKRVRGLVVTAFVRADDAESYWFHVTPETETSLPSWYAVVAMDSEYILLSGSHVRGSDSLFERDPDEAPLDAVVRICHNSEYFILGR